jgi:hypothetical protein
MKAAKGDRLESNDVRSWGPPLRQALAEIILEAMSSIAPNGVEATMRKWLTRVRPSNEAGSVADIVAEAQVLARELSIHEPSFLSVRPVDRLARKAGERPTDHGRAAQLLPKSQFRLFRLVGRKSENLYEALDIPSGQLFLIFESGFAPSAVGIDLAGRVCPFPENLHVLAGPLIALAFGGVGRVEDYIRLGKGIGNGQRCAHQVYRDYIRQGAMAGLGFGVETKGQRVKLSHSDEELDAFVADWHEFGEGASPTGDALADARELTSTRRILCALVSCLETGDSGRGAFAAIYRAMARIQMETLHRRASIGSGEPEPLSVLRSALAEAVRDGKYPPRALSLFIELAQTIEGRPKAAPRGADDDLTRVIERIRALRAKTTDQGCTEPEALRAAEKVAELLERYGLSLSEIDLRKQACEGFGIDTGRRKREPVDRCTPTIAEFCDCRAWSETSPTGTIRYVFFGLPADVEAGRYLHDLVAAAFANETAAFKAGSLYREMSGAEKRAAVSSFQIGLAGGICEKLSKLKAQRAASAAKSSGRDLVPVKASILDEEIEKLGLAFQTKRGRRRRKLIATAYAEGQAAGGRVEVNEGLE